MHGINVVREIVVPVEVTRLQSAEAQRQVEILGIFLDVPVNITTIYRLFLSLDTAFYPLAEPVGVTERGEFPKRIE